MRANEGEERGETEGEKVGEVAARAMRGLEVADDNNLLQDVTVWPIAGGG